MWLLICQPHLTVIPTLHVKHAKCMHQLYSYCFAFAQFPLSGMSPSHHPTLPHLPAELIPKRWTWNVSSRMPCPAPQGLFGVSPLNHLYYNRNFPFIAIFPNWWPIPCGQRLCFILASPKTLSNVATQKSMGWINKLKQQGKFGGLSKRWEGRGWKRGREQEVQIGSYRRVTGCEVQHRDIMILQQRCMASDRY